LSTPKSPRRSLSLAIALALVSTCALAQSNAADKPAGKPAARAAQEKAGQEKQDKQEKKVAGVTSDKPADKPIARIEPVPPNPSDPILTAMFDGIRSRGAEPLNMHRTLGNAPKVFKAYVDLAYALRAAATVPREYRELIILRTTYLAGGDYEIAQHRPMALSCGMTRPQLDSIANWKKSKLFDERQRAILAYADEMAAQKGVSEATFTQLSKFFSTQEIVELTITAGFYTAASRVTKALDVRLEPGAGQESAQYGRCG
jgi:alkylhydroperoxidase family enzyme